MTSKLFDKDYPLQEWIKIAVLQSLIGGTILAIVKGIWFGLSEGSWLVLAAFPVTVLVTMVGAVLTAALSHGIYQKLRSNIKSRETKNEHVPPA